MLQDALQSLKLPRHFRALRKNHSDHFCFFGLQVRRSDFSVRSRMSNNPLFPLENTVADLNMDMIGRVKGVADTTDETPMTDKSGVFVITGNQSKELVAYCR